VIWNEIHLFEMKYTSIISWGNQTKYAAATSSPYESVKEDAAYFVWFPPGNNGGVFHFEKGLIQIAMELLHFFYKLFIFKI